MKKALCLILFLIAGQFLGQTVGAEEPFQVRAVERKIDLAALVVLVEKQNLDLALTNNRIEQAKANYWGSYAGFMPSLRAQQYVEKFSGSDIFIQEKPVSVERTTYRPRVVLDYQLPLGGKPFFQVRSSKLKLEKARLDHDQNRQAALLEATTDYYRWLRDIANKNVTEQILKEAEQHVLVNEAKLKRGYGTQLEVEQAKIERAERQNAVLDARGEEANSAATLAAYLNVPLDDTLIPFEESLKPVEFWTRGEIGLSGLYKLAEANRPDVKGLSYQIKAMKSQYYAAFSDLLPTVGLTGYYGGVGPKREDLRETFQRGAYVSIDLLKNMGVGTVGNIKLSKTQLEEAIIQRERKLNTVRESLSVAYHNWQKYRNKLEVAEQKVASANEAYRIAKVRKVKGFGIELEVLKAQSDVATACWQLQDAIFNYNTSQLRLLYETGQLTPISILAQVEDKPPALSQLP